MKEIFLKRANINIMLAATLICFVVGIATPFMTISKFIVVDNTISILGGIHGLLQEGSWFLFFIITLFSIIFPIAKIGTLIALNNCDNTNIRKYAKWVETFGKWSMLDVFVAAVLVVTLKLGSIVTVTIHYGIYIFSASVILSMIAATLTIKRIYSKY